jgi:hypothetical protein
MDDMGLPLMLSLTTLTALGQELMVNYSTHPFNSEHDR